MNYTPSSLESARQNVPGVITLKLPADSLRTLGAKLPDGVTVLVVPPQVIQPEFIRLPSGKKGEVCPVTGLPRSSLRDLLAAAGKKIKTHKLKKPGSLNNGQVLIHRQSLIDFVNQCPPPDWCEEEDGKEDA